MKALLLASTALTRNVPDQPGGAPVAAPAPAAAEPAAAQPEPAPPAAASPPAPEPAAAAPVGDAPAAAPPAEAPKPAEEAKPDAHAKPTLLEVAEAAAKPAEAPKPGEPAKVDPAKPDEAPKPAEAAPVYDFKFAEGVEPPPKEAIGAYTELMQTNKIAPEVAQSLLDRHVAEMTTFAERLVSDQHRAFTNMREGWQKDVMADPEIGGAGHQTAMRAIAATRDLLVSEADRTGFSEFLRTTGAGDNPYFLKMLHNASKFLMEPILPGEAGQPPKDAGKVPGAKRGLRGLYATKQ